MPGITVIYYHVMDGIWYYIVRWDHQMGLELKIMNNESCPKLVIS